jgi:hypothetical protein
MWARGRGDAFSDCPKRGFTCANDADSALSPYMASIFGAQNTGLPHDTFANASGKLSASLRTSA